MLSYIITILVITSVNSLYLPSFMRHQWYLDRIDQPQLPLDYNTFTKVDLNNSEIDIYVIDGGIDINHPQFSEKRPIWGINLSGDNITGDCDGHGTHVASLIGGKTYGVTKGANIIAVKVFPCNAKKSVVPMMKAFEWITQNHNKSRTSIINMSLGVDKYEPLDNVVNKAIDNGIHVIVSAGNDNKDACNRSPTHLPRVITVGSIDTKDNKSWFSNWGNCIKVYAPGSDIIGALPNGRIGILSGTSMATPIATGVFAQYIQKYGKDGRNKFLQNITAKKLVQLAK